MGNPAKPATADAETPLETLEQEYENTPLEEPEKPSKRVATAATEDDELPVEPAKPKISARLLRMCKDLDITEDEIEGLNEDAVQVLVSREIRRARAEAARNARSENESDRRKVERQEEEEDLEWGEFEDAETGRKRKATDEDIHPAILPVLKAQAKEIKALKAQLAGTKQATDVSAQERFEQAFDASCSRFKKTLGDGTYTQLKGTPYTKKREVIFKEVVAMIQADKSIQLDEAVDRAVREIYGVKLKNPAKPVVEDEEDEEDSEASKARSNYTSGKTARPQQRKGKNKKSPQAAEDAVEAWLQDNMPAENSDDDDESEY